MLAGFALVLLPVLPGLLGLVGLLGPSVGDAQGRRGAARGTSQPPGRSFDALVGAYRNLARDGGEARVATAVDAGIEGLGPMIRRVARRRLLVSNPPFRTLRIDDVDGLVTVAYEGVREYSAPLGGNAMIARAPDDSRVEVGYRWRGGTLVERIEASQGSSVIRYQLGADGETLRMSARIESPRLPSDIRFVLRFRRR